VAAIVVGAARCSKPSVLGCGAVDEDRTAVDEDAEGRLCQFFTAAAALVGEATLCSLVFSSSLSNEAPLLLLAAVDGCKVDEVDGSPVGSGVNGDGMRKN